MENSPKTGTTHKFERTVNPDLCIQFDGLPPVLSTPHLIWLLEECSMELIEPFLVDDEMTLGTHVDVEHLGPALTGDVVTFQATVIQASGREILCRVEATLLETTLARGLHRRTVVSRSRLAKRLLR